jgi:hypothetical protein
MLDYILNNADFDTTNDIRLEAAVMERWPEYGRLLRGRRDDYDFLLYKYFQGFRHLHDTNPQYFETIEFDQRSGYKVRAFTKEALYIRFLALVSGFRMHWDDLANDAELRMNAVQRFKSALNNPTLTQQLFPDAGRTGSTTPSTR